MKTCEDLAGSRELRQQINVGRADTQICPKCKKHIVDIFKYCDNCRQRSAERQRTRRKALRELGGTLGFARHVIKRSKTSRDADVLLEAIVRALRDKKSKRGYINQLIRCYPVVRNGGNPYRILFDEIERLNLRLQSAEKIPKN